MSSKKKFWLIIIILLAIFLRFFNLNWGEGFYFHPDENNMARALLYFDNEGDPQFYAYGQLPLFLAWGGIKFWHLFTNKAIISFNQAVFSLRFFSAFFSVLTIPVVYGIVWQLGEKKWAWLAALLTVFTPGLIQSAHFGTTESLLVFFAVLILFLAIRFLKEGKKNILMIGGIIAGLAVGTKISSAVFLLPFLIAILWRWYQNKTRFVLVCRQGFLLIDLTIIFALIAAPFLILSNQASLNTLKYEISVAQGKSAVFYTRQFLQTKPYWFQIRKVFPFTLGWPLLIAGILGLGKMIKNIIRRKSQSDNSLLVFLSLLVVYFLYFGRLFVKWTRFMTPILPLFSIAAIFILKKLPRKYLRFLLPLLLLPGFLFFIIVYCQSDIRWRASAWFEENIPENVVILSESGNVVNLPLFSTNATGQKIINFDFYHLENDIEKKNELIHSLAEADYILIPSRRIFANFREPTYPWIERYYQKLFNGQLGFEEIKIFRAHIKLPFSNYQIFYPDQAAEETWLVFDHPTIRWYKKTLLLNEEEYRQLLF